MTGDIRLRCSGCGHTWVEATLPMEAGALAKKLKLASCPTCVSRAHTSGVEGALLNLPPIYLGLTMAKIRTMGGYDSWYDTGEQDNTENMMRVTFENTSHSKRLFVRLLNGAAYVSTIHGCIPQQSAPMLSGDCLRLVIGQKRSKLWVYQAGALMHRPAKED